MKATKGQEIGRALRETPPMKCWDVHGRDDILMAQIIAKDMSQARRLATQQFGDLWYRIEEVI